MGPVASSVVLVSYWNQVIVSLDIAVRVTKDPYGMLVSATMGATGECNDSTSISAVSLY